MIIDAPKLCLNMIVKNETSNLPRCLASVADYVSCWVIGDTGSTDGTQDLIRKFFAERGIPGELHSFPFHDFEQARNEALARAYASPLVYDYLLLTDADMELVVKDPDFRSKLTAPGYRVIQRSSLTYWNVRLIRRDAGARYYGVTHEYLDVPEGVQELHDVWYKDHASGANRADKFERDIRLLSAGLKKEPENRRYWFYLAQSQRDAGQHDKAAVSYAKRADMGGWEEEAWYARLQEARCLLSLKDDGGFLRQALTAFNQRPHRAEPLYDLARFYRERGMNNASALFCEAGLAIPRPTDDILFIEDFVYTAGLLEEYSISANYSKDPVRKDRGFAACEYLTFGREIPQGARELARSNLRFYLKPAREMMPSFDARPIGFIPPAGYRVMNPSVARRGDELLLIQRTVNYTLVDEFRYVTPDGGPIHTRNFLLRLNANLEVEAASEIMPPDDMPPPQCDLVKGFEDLRLFAWRGELWCSATVRELTPEAWCQQVLARIERRDDGSHILTDWRVISPAGQHEKNWMPQVDGDTLRLIYSCDPTRLMDEYGKLVAEIESPIAADWFRGGSQAIPFDGGWLALVHEARVANNKRYYLHNFVWFDETNTLKAFSRRFFFHENAIEFAAGMAWHPDGKRLLISFGVVDTQSWIATVDPADVRRLLHDLDGLREKIYGRAPKSILEDIPSRAPVVRAEAANVAPQPEPAIVTGYEPTGHNDPVQSAPEGICSSGEHAPEPTSSSLDAGGSDDAVPAVANMTSVESIFYDLAPFLRVVDAPDQRREQSRAFDERISPFLSAVDVAALPVIHCFYEVLSEQARHDSLVAAVTSMRRTGHRVRVWSYSPEKLRLLLPQGVELCDAADVVPRGLFEQVMAGSEVRYFSDIFRYAVLYEHGGLWMDSDIILLRPFPYRGDYFFNLQWRGAHVGHFVCGNVIYAKPFSHHLRNLYEKALEWFFGPQGWAFGDIGPKLLSDYIGSSDGAALRDRTFSPMFFNSIDWMELDRFDRPISDLADYLNDDRVFGVHLWNNKTQEKLRENNGSLISLLSDPGSNLPSFEKIADRCNTDKNRVSGNRHFYARIYDRMFAPQRYSVKSLIEIGLCRGLAEHNQGEVPSVDLWLTYFPFCHVTGVDLTDFSTFNNDRFTSYVCDQSKLNEVRSVAQKIEAGSVDIIIDDGSHASYDQQMTFREFFPLLRPGGLYFIEDLDWQPPGEVPEVALTKQVFREIQQERTVRSPDPLGLSALIDQITETLFFDSQMELSRARLLGGLVAIRKAGGPGYIW
jgi:glycosyltransferase involved in cell wall biosynthesis